MRLFFENLGMVVSEIDLGGDYTVHAVYLLSVPFTVCKLNLIKNDKENVEWFPMFLH